MLLTSHSSRPDAETIRHLQSLIENHLECKRRCDRCLTRIHEPIARAELRRLSAMHHRQAHELREIVTSAVSLTNLPPARRIDRSSNDSYAPSKFGAVGADAVLTRARASETDMRQVYSDVIDIVNSQPAERVLRRHSVRISDATIRLDNLQRERNPI